MKETSPLVKTIIKGIQEKKGYGITVIDLRGISGTVADFFIVCQGNSPMQVEAIASSIDDMVREELHEKAAGVVGLGLSQWVAIDFTDVIVHIFVPDLRQFYDIEGLWSDAPTTHVPDLD